MFPAHTHPSAGDRTSASFRKTKEPARPAVDGHQVGPKTEASTMNQRIRIAGLIAALMLAFAASPALAAPASDDVLAVDKMRAANAVNAEKLLQQQGGSRIVDASPGLQNDQPIASFRFNAHGTRRFAHLTADNIGCPFAIVINDRVFSAPVIREPILGGSGQISGNFTLAEANTVAMLLRAGTLPGRLSVVDQQILKPAGNAAKR
jgi:preprotein translocase subunit SecD